MTAQCVICAREAEHGYLCDSHFTRLAAMLRDIEDEAAMLDTRPSFAQRTGPGGGSLAFERAPLNLDAVVARDPRRGLMRWASDDFDPWGLDDTASVLETLDSRCRTVNEEGGFELPAPTISGCRDYLTRNLTWIARQPWCDEFFTEIRDLLGQLQRSNKTLPDKPEAFCVLPRYESTCGGRIWRREHQRFVWRVKGDRCVREKVEIADGAAYCERCRAEWDGEALDRLHLIEEQRKAEAARPKTEDGRRMLTAQEIVAHGYVSSVSNVRAMASRRGVRAVLGHYDPEWFEEKATA